MKQLLIIISLFGFPYIISAQYAEKIVSGRPGQSNGPFGVGKNIYQVQSGFTYKKRIYKPSSFKIKDESFSNTSVFRIGILEKTELRGGYNFNFIETSKVSYPEPNSNSGYIQESKYNLENLSLGIRQNLLSQKGVIPATGFQFTALFDENATFKSDIILYQFRLLLQHKIIENLILNTNLTAVYQSQNFDYTFSLQYALSQKTRFVAEMFGTKFNENFSLGVGFYNNFDVGFGYFVTDNFILDFSIGHGYFFDVQNNYFISTGFSYRINKRN